MDTLGRTWQLYRQSFAALSADGEILLFPVASGISAVLLAAGFFLPLYHDGTLEAAARGHAGWDGYAMLFLWYYLNHFLTIFFNSALIGCAAIRLSGGDPTVSDGFRIAFERTARIAVWALVAATVGVALSAFNDRRNRLLRIVGSALSVGWTMLTYLIVPVLVIEDRPVYDAIHRSAELFRKRWGEELLGSFGFGLLNFLFLIPGVALAAMVWRLDHAAALIVGVVYVLFLATISSAVSGVFKVALYRFAASGAPPAGFSAEAMDPTGGWRRRPRE